MTIGATGSYASNVEFYISPNAGLIRVRNLPNKKEVSLRTLSVGISKAITKDNNLKISYLMTGASSYSDLNRYTDTDGYNVKDQKQLEYHSHKTGLNYSIFSGITPYWKGLSFGANIGYAKLDYTHNKSWAVTIFDIQERNLGKNYSGFSYGMALRTAFNLFLPDKKNNIVSGIGLFAEANIDKYASDNSIYSYSIFGGFYLAFQ